MNLSFHFNVKNNRLFEDSIKLREEVKNLNLKNWIVCMNKVALLVLSKL